MVVELFAAFRTSQLRRVVGSVSGQETKDHDGAYYNEGNCN